MYKAYRRVRFGRAIVVVSGLPRSGTSLAMKMLEAGGMGLVTDGRRAADEDNPNGYFEDERVKDLEAAGDMTWLRAARGRAIKIICHLIKRLPADNNYRVLFMQRDVREIIASQDKMLARRGQSSDAPADRTIALLERELRDARFFLRRRPQFEVLELHYKELLERPRDQAQRIAAFVAEPLDLTKMAAAVSPALYRNRAG